MPFEEEEEDEDDGDEEEVSAEEGDATEEEQELALAGAFASLWTSPSLAARRAFVCCGGELQQPPPNWEQRAVSRWARARLGLGHLAFFRAAITGDRSLAAEAAELLAAVSSDLLDAAPATRWPWQRLDEGSRALAAELAALSGFACLLKAIMQGVSMQYLRAFYNLRASFAALGNCGADVVGTPGAGYADAGRAAVLIFLSLAPPMAQRVASLAGLAADRDDGLEKLRSTLPRAEAQEGSCCVDSQQWAVVMSVLWHIASSRENSWKAVDNSHELEQGLGIVEHALANLPESLIFNWMCSVLKQRLGQIDDALAQMEVVQRSGSLLRGEGLQLPRVDFGCAMLHFSRQRFQEAASSLSRASDIASQYSARGMSLVFLGICHSCLGQEAEATNAWQKLADMPTKGPLDTILVRKARSVSARRHGIVSAADALYLVQGRLTELPQDVLTQWLMSLQGLEGIGAPGGVKEGAQEDDSVSIEERLAAWLLTGAILARLAGRAKQAEQYLRAVAAASLDGAGTDLYHGPYARFELAQLAFRKGEHIAAKEHLEAASAAIETVRNHAAAGMGEASEQAGGGFTLGRAAAQAASGEMTQLRILGFGGGEPPVFTFEKALSNSMASLSRELARQQGAPVMGLASREEASAKAAAAMLERNLEFAEVDEAEASNS